MFKLVKIFLICGVICIGLITLIGMSGDTESDEPVYKVHNSEEMHKVINTLIETGTPADCKRMKAPWFTFSDEALNPELNCIWKFAKAKKDVSICKLIPSEQLNSYERFCIGDVVRITKNVKDCDQFSDTIKDGCISEVSQAIPDRLICKNITTPDTQKGCEMVWDNIFNQ
ncbi:MAG: hypothetical protein V4576_02620 [Patescibacteria group bacterium]